MKRLGFIILSNSKDKKMAIDFYKKAINLTPDFEYSEYINKFLVESK